MEIMHGLVFDADEEEWMDGTIYDSRTGKNWNVKAWINNEGILKVRGYWHFEILGKKGGFEVYNNEHRRHGILWRVYLNSFCTGLLKEIYSQTIWSDITFLTR